MSNRKTWFVTSAVVLIVCAPYFLLRPARDASPTIVSADVAASQPAPASTASRIGASPSGATLVASGPKHAGDALCIVKPPTPPRIASDASGDPFVEADPAPSPSVALLAARQRVMANLRASADPYANAVAVWLVIPGDDPDGSLMADRDRKLAAMAASTRDPRLYAMALRACWHKSDRDCQGLSARRWAELDPDNAMPWTLLLDEAGERRDISGMQEAMFHITNAARIDERDFAPLRPIIDAAADDDANLVGAQALAVEAIGLSAAQAGPVSLTACGYATPANANVYQQCLAMRDLLENHSDSPMLRMFGASIDRRLTGSDAALKRVDAQMKQWAEAFPQSSTGCRDLRQKLGLLHRAAVAGPIAVMGEVVR